MIMKQAKYIALGIFGCVALHTYASVERVNIDLGFTEGQASVEFFLDNKLPQNELVFSKKQQASINSKNYQVLNKYYQHLTKGEVDKMLPLLAELDNTRANITEYLTSNPNAYRRYSNLDKVSTDLSILWGVYSVHSLTLTSNKGQGFNWREVTVCNGECYVSNMLDAIDNQDELFIEGVEYLKEHLKSKKPRQSSRKDFDQSIAIFPTGYSTYQNVKQYPFRLFIKPQPMKAVKVNFSQACEGSKYTDSDVTAVVATLCGLKLADTEKHSIEAIFSKMGIGIKEPALIPLIKKVVSEEQEQVSQTQASDIPVFRTLLPVKEFVNAVQEWEGVEFVSRSFKGERGVVYFRPFGGVSNKYHNVQSIGLIRKGERRQVLVVPDFALGRLPVSAQVSNFISSKQVSNNS